MHPLPLLTILFLALSGNARAFDDSPTNQPAAILVSHEDWQLVGEHFRGTDGLAANTNGEVFFSDHASNCIYKITLAGQLSVFKEQTGTGGLIFAPNGKLYACQGSKKRIVCYDMAGQEEIIAENLQPNDLVAAQNGNVYVTDSPNKKVWLIQGHEKRVVDEGITFPNGVRLSPDQTFLYVADYRGGFVYSFNILPDGSLTNRQPFFHLKRVSGSLQTSADGLAVDAQGRLYVTTEMGIQICNASGQGLGIIPKPQPKGPSSIAFGGKEFNTLFAACGDKIFKRKTQARGVPPHS